ncbi:unnamed protein product [Cuscuta europaea]|uniref:Eukaryotic translation initiation factor 3 subunit M n=1 Tax=Cuscuta europaea TaxID=41803 RepID=A0A9P0Z685_CUSEU|nr:unnamed protein product [Cuscuta europaea]
MIGGRWLDLASLMLTSAELVFSKISDKDAECIYTIISNLVKKPGSLDQVHEIAELISSKVMQQPTEKPALRLKILFNLYNLLDNPYSRFIVYMKALHFAISGKVTEHVLSSFKKMDNFLKEWNIGVKDRRELFLTISNILKEHKGHAKESFTFLTKYLSTFSGDDANTMNEAKDAAVQTIIEFVKVPDMYQCDLLDMPAVAQLEKDARYAPVYQLLRILLTQRLNAYLEFEASNSTLMKTHGLVHEDCITKMRLMSLVDLASNDSGRIPYAVIKDVLQIDVNEIESWIVKAITAKLIDCKIDQMNQVVIVSHAIERVFGPNQWKSLQTKLEMWKGNIANLISTIQANKIVDDGSQAMQGLMIR